MRKLGFKKKSKLLKLFYIFKKIEYYWEYWHNWLFKRLVDAQQTFFFFDQLLSYLSYWISTNGIEFTQTPVFDFQPVDLTHTHLHIEKTGVTCSYYIVALHPFFLTFSGKFPSSIFHPWYLYCISSFVERVVFIEM